MVETTEQKSAYEELKHRLYMEELEKKDMYAEREHRRKLERLVIHLDIASKGSKVIREEDYEVL